MHQVRLANLRELLPADRGWVAEHYGPKVAGNVLLREHQGRAPVRYEVPEGVAIPAARSGYRLTEADLVAGVVGITRDLRWHRWQAREASVVPLLLRSSDIDSEGSGEHDSPVVLFDPRDRAGSVRHIFERAQQLRERDSMGLLLQRMVGAATRQSWGHYVWGEHLVSAVGETHNPYLPDEVLVAMASGLATQVVTPTAGDPINITMDRATGEITQVSNRSTAFSLQETMAGNPVLWAAQYAQQVRDVLWLSDGRYQTLPLDDRYVARLGHYALQSGRLGPLADDYRAIWYTDRARIGVNRTEAQPVGALPFRHSGVLQQWHDVLRYFGNTLGPHQLEGAHLSGRLGAMALFQSLPVPFPAGWGRVLTLEAPDMVSTSALGVVDCECPLVFVDGNAGQLGAARAELEAFDASMQGRYYAVYAIIQNGDFIAETPQASIRLEWGKGSKRVTSHAVTDIRLRMGRRDGMPRALATGIGGKIPGTPQRSVGIVHFFDHAHIQSNGQELRVKIL